MNTIHHINRNIRKNSKPGIAMSGDNLKLIKEALESSDLNVKIQVPENFIEDDLNVEDALKVESNKLQ